MKHMSEVANSLHIQLKGKTCTCNQRPCGNKGWPSGFINVNSVSLNFFSWISEELSCLADFLSSF